MSSVSKKYRVSGPVTDPRYMDLERSLCKNYGHDADIKQVAIIIKGIESLHLPPKRPKDTKPRIGLKIQQFMKERGIAF